MAEPSVAPATIETARGPIAAGDLGVTLMHEHVVNVNAEVARDQPQLGIGRDRDAVRDRVVAELRRAHDAGVDAIVDATALGHGRDVAFVAEVAREVDLHIVIATGIYTFDALPRIFQHRTGGGGDPRDLLVELFVRDITEGVAGTGVKAGVIKCATDAQGVTPAIDRVLRAAAVAHRETGVPITTHTDVHHRTGLDQQRVFAEEGVDLTRVVIGHSGDSADFDYLQQLLDAGSTIGCDRFGLHLDGWPPLEARVATVARLCAMGYADQIVLSHDKTVYSDTYTETWPPPCPDWHLTHLHDVALPALREAGVTEEELETMLVHNPRRLLTRGQPY